MSLPLLVPSSRSDKLILDGFVLAIIERTINAVALRISPADSSPDSWRTNAAAAGVPACFLQGKTFETSLDLTTTIEESPFHNNVNQAFANFFFPNCVRWLALGRPDPVPQAVLTEYKLTFNACTRNRCLFLSKDSLGLAPAPTQVGDRVCILLGGDAPFILRPRQKSARTTPCKEAEPESQGMSSTPPPRYCTSHTTRLKRKLAHGEASTRSHRMDTYRRLLPKWIYARRSHEKRGRSRLRQLRLSLTPQTRHSVIRNTHPIFPHSASFRIVHNNPITYYSTNKAVSHTYLFRRTPGPQKLFHVPSSSIISPPSLHITVNLTPDKLSRTHQSGRTCQMPLRQRIRLYM